VAPRNVAKSAEQSTGEPTTADLREAGVHGLRWTAMARTAVEVVLMASMILLARLISPAEFGYFAVAIIVQELALVITSEGVGTALVQRPTVDREHLQAGLWLALVVGLVLGLLTLVAASVIVVPVFGARTAELVRLATPLFIISAAGTVPMALLRRRLAFRQLSIIDVATSVMRVVGSVALAIAGLQGEALVLGGIAAGITTMVLAWVYAPAPAPRPRLSAARELMSYGLPASIASVSWVGFRNCDYAIVSARLGAVQAGYYFRAYMLAVEYQKKISIVMGQVGLPVLARSGEELSVLRGQMVRLLAILTFPMLAVLTITAPQLVPWLFGAEWAPAVEPMQWLAVGGAATLVIDAIGVALMASGRPRALLGFGVGHFASYALAVLVASRFGLAAVAAAASIVHTAFLGVAYALMLRGTDERPLRTMWAEIGPATASSLGLVAAAVPVNIALSAAGTPTIVQLAVVTAVGLAAYAAALRIAFPAAWRDVLAVARRVLPRPPRRIRLRRALEVS
jgi:lipopolysaccharide exporter